MWLWPWKNSRCSLQSRWSMNSVGMVKNVPRAIRISRRADTTRLTLAGTQPAAELYQDAIADLFQHYRSLSETVFQFLASRTPKPEEMKQDAYERTLRARAFDITRYLLPLATNTSLGEIVNARTLETQVSRLLSDPHEEIRRLGELLKRAASQPAWNLNQDRYRDLVSRLREKDEALANEAGDLLLKDVRVSPTLVKYAEPNAYQIDARRELTAAATEVMAGEAIESAKLVDLLEDEPLEIELATTLLYEHCHYPYRQIRRKVEALADKRRAEIIDIGIRLRGRHDELLRAYCSGQKFRFDILMDIGGFRDMHRHRRCVQIVQGFTTQHGFDTPEEILAAGAGEEYMQAMQRAAEASSHLRSQLGGGESAEEKSEYLIPLAYRKRTLFKMDLAEAVYISELRSKPEGHISYRRVAYAMYEEVIRRYPALTEIFRVRDINEPVDLLKR